MNPVRNPILFIVAIIVFLFFAALSVNVLVTDWKYAHKVLQIASYSNAHRAPFNWLGYKIELGARKLIRSVTDKGNIGLPQIRLYLSESLQQSLMSDIPDSTKEWKKGYIFNNNSLQKIQIRHQGDDPTNWFLGKKTFKIKTNKNEMIGLNRSYDLIVPEYDTFLRDYSAKNVARQMGILTPKVELVEVFLNDESQGIYIKVGSVDESFLRRNAVMPVNLYKGEQSYNESIFGLFPDLYNNTSLWSKRSHFNEEKEEDKTDLRNFLSLIRDAETDELALEELFEKVDIDVWSKFLAFEILLQTYSSDSRHNQRLVLDPWSGIVYPIAHDPWIGPSFFVDNSNRPSGVPAHTSLTASYPIPAAPRLEWANTLRETNLWLLLNRSSKYIDQKYQNLLYYTTQDPVLLREAKHINELGDLIETSYNRDIGHVSLHGSHNFSENIEKYVESLSLFNDYIVERLYATPNSAWVAEDNGFVVTVDGEIPVSEIIVTSEGSLPDYIAIDWNGDNIIDSGDIRVPSEKGSSSMTIPVKLYANRITVASGGIHRDNDLRYKDNIVVNTGFKFITSNNVKIKSISASNPFSGVRTTLNNRKTDYILPSRLNTPIVDDKIEGAMENEILFSGILDILNNQHIREPVSILPGTVINLAADASLIFHNKVTAKGTPESPILFRRKDSDKAWGTVALQGVETTGSIFSNISMSGGSGSEVNGIFYTSMLSLHNTSNIIIEKSRFHNNEKYDDMLHIVYGNNITLSNISLKDAVFDAIDIDMAKNIIIKNIDVINAGNDAIDFMETEALVDQVNLYKSGDKGVSVGENSNVLIYNSLIHENVVGIASKDGSYTQVLYSNLDSNKAQISLYKKNWRYGDGGYAQISNSRILNGVEDFNVDSYSKIMVNDTDIVSKDNHQEKYSNKDDLIFDKKNHPLYEHIEPVNNIKIRGFQN